MDEDILNNTLDEKPVSDVIFFEEPIQTVTTTTTPDTISTDETTVKGTEPENVSNEIDTSRISDEDLDSQSKEEDEIDADSTSSVKTESVRKLADPNPEDCLKR